MNAYTTRRFSFLLTLCAASASAQLAGTAARTASAEQYQVGPSRWFQMEKGPAATALARLSPEERSELAARAQELAPGGSGVEILALAIIIGLLVILILELLGRRVISRR